MNKFDLIQHIEAYFTKYYDVISAGISPTGRMIVKMVSKDGLIKRSIVCYPSARKIVQTIVTQY